MTDSAPPPKKPPPPPRRIVAGAPDHPGQDAGERRDPRGPRDRDARPPRPGAPAASPWQAPDWRTMYGNHGDSPKKNVWRSEPAPAPRPHGPARSHAGPAGSPAGGGPERGERHDRRDANAPGHEAFRPERRDERQGGGRDPQSRGERPGRDPQQWGDRPGRDPQQWGDRPGRDPQSRGDRHGGGGGGRDPQRRDERGPDAAARGAQRRDGRDDARRESQGHRPPGDRPPQERPPRGPREAGAHGPERRDERRRPYDDRPPEDRARRDDRPRAGRPADPDADRRRGGEPRRANDREGTRDPRDPRRARDPRVPRPPLPPAVRRDTAALATPPSAAEVPEGATQAVGIPPAPPRPDEPPRADQRLSKVLAERGLASRREADEWIAAGWVKVDGEVAVLGTRVLPTQAIEIDPAAHTQQARRVTILLHKPVGYVSGQAEDGYEPASILVTQANHWGEDPSRERWHPGHARGLAPAGRLDIDSTGLLVLTQDGRVARHLIGEDSDVEKEYLVRVEYRGEGPFLEASLELLRHGLELDGHALRPAKVSWANEDQLRFVLREGRKRQIRRMCEAVGLVVTGLKRVRIGSVVLGRLPQGQWRYLREDERF
jgi:23S rRNA pseudouridine2604 synthase